MRATLDNSKLELLDVNVDDRGDGRALAWSENLTTHVYVDVLLPEGRPGGQTLVGGTGPSETLSIRSTTDVTPGKILIGDVNVGVWCFDESKSFVGIGTQFPTAQLHMDLSIQSPSWSSNGIWMRLNVNPGSTVTNTSTAGGTTIPDMAICSIGNAQIRSTNGPVTYTQASTLYIVGPPNVADANTVITNPWSLFIVTGNSKLAGRVAMGAGNPSPVGILTIDPNNTSFTTTTGINGCVVRQAGRTFTDTGDTTTQTAWHMNSFMQMTLAATTPIQVNATATLYVQGPPIAGANMTLASPTAIRADSGDIAFAGRVGAGTLFPAASLHVGGNLSQTAWTTNGIGLRIAAATYTDTSSTAGTVAAATVHSIGAPTVASTNAVTYTDYSTLRLFGAPIAGTNTTITRPWTVHVEAGNSRFRGGMLIGIGSTALNASALLQLDSTTQGFLAPRATTSLITAVVTPTEGLHMWDTTTHSPRWWDGTSWKTVALIP